MLKHVLSNNFRINYVIACWSGDRRKHDIRYVESREFYLRSHIESLLRLRHSYVYQITVCVPYNPDESSSFREYLLSLPSVIGNASVVVFERSNDGLSYGSLSDVYGCYGNAFGYYIFMEDDYVFCLDDFDKIMVRLMRLHINCGYLCGYFHYGHAGSSCGIFREDCLRAVWNRFGKLPHSRGSNYLMNEASGQVGQSRAIIEAGFDIFDTIFCYRTGFRMNDNIIWFGPVEAPPLFIPL